MLSAHTRLLVDAEQHQLPPELFERLVTLLPPHLSDVHIAVLHVVYSGFTRFNYSRRLYEPSMLEMQYKDVRIR